MIEAVCYLCILPLGNEKKYVFFVLITLIERGRVNPCYEELHQNFCTGIVVWADILVKFALFELQDYLTGTWGLSFTHAAGIINIWNGIYLILQPLFLLCIGRLLKYFQLLVISSSAYTLGTWFLFMSAPPVLANATGTCKEYKKECVGEAQKALFYIGLAFIAVGIAGNNVSIKSFLMEQQVTL